MTESAHCQEYLRRIDEAAHHLEHTLGHTPDVGIILGSGLGGFAEKVGHSSVDYLEIPQWPKTSTSVEGHAGRLVQAEVAGHHLAILSGRYHHYEGLPSREIVFPVRVLAQLRVDVMVVTNAAGGIREDLRPGDLMLIEDHLNLQGVSPLAGEHAELLGPRFVDLTQAYDPGLRALMQQAAAGLGLPLATGVYAATSGPEYETPAEVRVLRLLGADAVGMSTTAEVVAARQHGLRVVGLSTITNRAAGLSNQPLSHDEVLDHGAAAVEQVGQLLQAFLEVLPPAASRTA